MLVHECSMPFYSSKIETYLTNNNYIATIHKTIGTLDSKCEVRAFMHNSDLQNCYRF
jgi:hypothetical protein